jgi:hypothetical protein
MAPGEVLNTDSQSGAAPPGDETLRRNARTTRRKPAAGLRDEGHHPARADAWLTAAEARVLEARMDALEAVLRDLTEQLRRAQLPSGDGRGQRAAPD